ncbi:hypothetical protein GCM10009105_17550 [Dokdonella soli]|uniref:Uncharacterized protein n=1 Tax=Dokdonella soli TaxID=529810 RepID=A0ABN1IHK0_9GAMM
MIPVSVCASFFPSLSLSPGSASDLSGIATAAVEVCAEAFALKPMLMQRAKVDIAPNDTHA